VRGILKQISETYGAKVEVSPQRQAIRVTSDYETCLDILKLIIHTTENIRSSLVNFPADFRPKLRSSNPLKEYEVIIQQIMQSTNTIIRGETATALNREVRATDIHLLLATNSFLADHLLSWTR